MSATLFILLWVFGLLITLREWVAFQDEIGSYNLERIDGEEIMLFILLPLIAGIFVWPAALLYIWGRKVWNSKAMNGTSKVIRRYTIAFFTNGKDRRKARLQK